MKTLSNLFAAVAALFGWKRDAEARANTPQMQIRAQGAVDQDLKDAAAKAIREGDLAKLREGLAE